MATINAQTRDNYAARTGSWLGRGWLKARRREKQLAAWLAGNGIPVGIANALFWIVKLALIAAALYFFLAVALVIVALWVLISILGHAELSTSDENKTDWRNGIYGFGLYDSKGFRIDPYDPNNP